MTFLFPFKPSQQAFGIICIVSTVKVDFLSGASSNTPKFPYFLVMWKSSFIFQVSLISRKEMEMENLFLYLWWLDTNRNFQVPGPRDWQMTSSQDIHNLQSCSFLTLEYSSNVALNWGKLLRQSIVLNLKVKHRIMQSLVHTCTMKTNPSIT